MSELQKKIDDASTRILAAQAERKERLASADAHEAAAREDRLVASRLKEELGELAKVLGHAQVASATQSAQSAAESAKAAAEASQAKAVAHEKEAADILAALKASKAEWDAHLAEAKAATPAS